MILLGIDVSTTGVKALLIDEAGQISLDRPEALTEHDREELIRWRCALVQVARHCGANAGGRCV